MMMKRSNRNIVNSLALVSLLGISSEPGFADTEATPGIENEVSAKPENGERKPEQNKQKDPDQPMPNNKKPSISSGQDFNPSEEISEDYSVPFPVDI
jgi:hypothetical protein